MPALPPPPPSPPQREPTTIIRMLAPGWQMGSVLGIKGATIKWVGRAVGCMCEGQGALALGRGVGFRVLAGVTGCQHQGGQGGSCRV